MKPLHRLIDLAETLTDGNLRINIDVVHGPGAQHVTMYVHEGNSMTLFAPTRYTVDDLLAHLEELSKAAGVSTSTYTLENLD